MTDAGNGVSLLRTLSSASFSELVTLELIGSFVVEDAAWSPLLSGARFPKLRHLGIGVYSFFLGRFGALIAKAPIVRQLRTLDLSTTPLMEADVEAILAGASAFAHLDTLALGPLLDAHDHAALRGLCANVVFSSAAVVHVPL